MIIDRQKLQALLHSPFTRPASWDLRREGRVFFIGGDLDPRETLETVFESHCLEPADLMLITFGGEGGSSRGEEHARLLKKNFHVQLMARFDYPTQIPELERCYVAGVDLVDIPLTGPSVGQERLDALTRATRVFPAWAVAATLSVGAGAAETTIATIDTLLHAGIVPLPELACQAVNRPGEELESVLRHLTSGLRERKAAIKPLLPLFAVTTPLTPANPGGVLKGFIGKIEDRRLLAASDLRRSLRVKQVEQSFESAGL